MVTALPDFAMAPSYASLPLAGPCAQISVVTPLVGTVVRYLNRNGVDSFLRVATRIGTTRHWNYGDAWVGSLARQAVDSVPYLTDGCCGGNFQKKLLLRGTFGSSDSFPGTCTLSVPYNEIMW